MLWFLSELQAEGFLCGFAPTIRLFLFRRVAAEFGPIWQLVTIEGNATDRYAISVIHATCEVFYFWILHFKIIFGVKIKAAI